MTHRSTQRTTPQTTPCLASRSRRVCATRACRYPPQTPTASSTSGGSFLLLSRNGAYPHLSPPTHLNLSDSQRAIPQRDWCVFSDQDVSTRCNYSLATEVQGTFRVNGSNKRMRDLQAAFETPPRVSPVSFYWHDLQFHAEAARLRSFALHCGEGLRFYAPHCLWSSSEYTQVFPINSFNSAFHHLYICPAQHAYGLSFPSLSTSAPSFFVLLSMTLLTCR